MSNQFLAGYSLGFIPVTQNWPSWEYLQSQKAWLTRTASARKLRDKYKSGRFLYC